MLRTRVIGNPSAPESIPGTDENRRMWREFRDLWDHASKVKAYRR